MSGLTHLQLTNGVTHTHTHASSPRLITELMLQRPLVTSLITADCGDTD